MKQWMIVVVVVLAIAGSTFAAHMAQAQTLSETLNLAAKLRHEAARRRGN